MSVELMNLVIKTAAFVTACGAILGAVIAVLKWFLNQDKKGEDIKKLKELHQKDMEDAGKREREDVKAIKDELCMLNFAMLAALDGLKQLNCNGSVTAAHEKLNKHLNQRAHDQI